LVGDAQCEADASRGALGVVAPDDQRAAAHEGDEAPLGRGEQAAVVVEGACAVAEDRRGRRQAARLEQVAAHSHDLPPTGEHRDGVEPEQNARVGDRGDDRAAGEVDERRLARRHVGELEGSGRKEPARRLRRRNRRLVRLRGRRCRLGRQIDGVLEKRERTLEHRWRAHAQREPLRAPRIGRHRDAAPNDIVDDVEPIEAGADRDAERDVHEVAGGPDVHDLVAGNPNRDRSKDFDSRPACALDRVDADAGDGVARHVDTPRLQDPDADGGRARGR